MAICYVKTSHENDLPCIGILTGGYFLYEEEGQDPLPCMRLDQTFNQIVNEMAEYGQPTFIHINLGPLKETYRSNKLTALVTAVTVTNDPSITITGMYAGQEMVLDGNLHPVDEAESDYYVDLTPHTGN